MTCLCLENPIVRFTSFWSSVDLFLDERMPIEVLIAIPALLVAVFVPIAIFMVDSKDNAFVWDKAVIFRKVLKSEKLFLGIIIFIFVPIFWKFGQIRALLLLPLFWSITVLLLAIVESYKWLIIIEAKDHNQESYRTKKREEYLKTLDDEQKQIIWPLTWKLNRSSRGVVDERKLVKIFIENMESMQSPDASILSNFIVNLEQVNLMDPVIHEDLIKFSLKNAGYLTTEEPLTYMPNAFDFKETVRGLYFAIVEKDLNSNFGFYSLFNHTRKYIKENNINEGVFIKNFAPQFFSILENNKQAHKVLDGFPKEWKITYSGVEDENTRPVTLGWLDAYMHWIVERNLLAYNSDKTPYDAIADSITEGLIPNIDLPVWSNFIVFHWTSYGQSKEETSEHAKLRNFVEGIKRFGLISKVHAFWENEKEGAEARFAKEREIEINETFDLATRTTIFPLLLDDKTLNNYLKEIKEYQTTEKDSAKKEKLSDLKELLEEFKNRLSK